MKMHNLKKLFKASAISLVISAATASYANPTDQVVAIVGQSVILKSDLVQGISELKRQIQSQNKTLPNDDVLESQALNQLIIQSAQLEQTKRYPVQVDEKTLNDAVLKVAQQNNTDSLEAFQKKLDSQAPGTYASLREQVLNEIKIQRLRQQQVMSRIKISDQDVENFLKSPEGQASIGTQAHVIHVLVSGEGTQEELTQKALEVKQALNDSNDVNAIQTQFSNETIKVQGSDMGFRSLSEIPAELATRITLMKAGDTSEPIVVKEGVHVIKLIERKANDKKVIVPQFKARHILIKPSEILSPENAKQTIDSIYNRVKAGEDFATLAATYSNDPGSARDGGSLGWVSPGTMVPEFEKVMQSTPVGEISQPFQSQFGWHILEVTDQRQHDMTHEAQERMARQILGERQFDAELDNWIREIRANTYVEIKK